MTPDALTIEAGLQAEQDLLASVCAGESEFGLLFWQPSDQALVMPRRLNRLPGFDAATEVSAAAGWPVLLRDTGGEPVPQSATTINIALVYAPPRSEGDLNRIESGYRRLCDPICQLLDELGGTSSLGEIDGAFCDGRFNVNLDGRKMVGTAQRWRQSQGGQRPVGLVHGAMLIVVADCGTGSPPVSRNNTGQPAVADTSHADSKPGRRLKRRGMTKA